MKHLIIGGGNLGKDLLLELNNPDLGVQPELLTKARGFDVTSRDAIEHMASRRPDTIWYCVGGGSVEENKPDHPDSALNYALNVEVPLLMAERLPRSIRLVFFSTDYCANEEDPSNPYDHARPVRSRYAMRKLEMEQRLTELGRHQTSVVRVGSLYGTHKPQKCLPYKILAKYGFSREPLRFPVNQVTPTPSRWLAAMLALNFETITGVGTHIHHCAPKGTVSVKDWALMILLGLREIDFFYRSSNTFDMERPLTSGLGCSFAAIPHWSELWGTYFNQRWYTPPSLKQLVPSIILGPEPGRT
jgi:dTDP-4-dehydrorhamnose reductase